MAHKLDKPFAISVFVLLFLAGIAVALLASPAPIDDRLRVRHVDPWPEREETKARLDAIIADKRPQMSADVRAEVVGALWAGATLIWSGRGRSALEREHATVTDAALLLAAQDWHESGFNPRAASRTGDLGFAQINHSNLRWLGITNWRDPWQSILGQSRYMGDLLAGSGRHGIVFAVAGYNCGGHLTSRGRIPNNGITPAYAARVMRTWREWRGNWQPTSHNGSKGSREIIPKNIPENGAKAYVVRPGDTLYLIAKRYGVSVGELARKNGITDQNVIRTGERLVIP